MTFRPPLLVFRVGQLGDTLVALPAFSYLRSIFPGRSIFLLTDRHESRRHLVSSWDVIKHTGWIDDVITYNADRSTLGGLIERIKIGRKIRRLGVRQAILLLPNRNWLQSLRDYVVFRFLLGIPLITGIQVSRRMPRQRLSPLPQIEPEWRRLLSIVEAAVPKCIETSFKFPIPEFERVAAGDLLAIRGIANQYPILALGIGSKMPAKRWPRHQFAEVLERVQKRFPSAVAILLGGEEEIGYCQNFESQTSTPIVNLVGKLSIMGSAAILEKSDIYLGNDSGVMHLAATVGTRCVAIFSARDFPGKWNPMGEEHEVLRHETSCAGCGLLDCNVEGMRCLTSITSEEVWKRVEKMLVDLE